MGFGFYARVERVLVRFLRHKNEIVRLPSGSRVEPRPKLAKKSGKTIGISALRESLQRLWERGGGVGAEAAPEKAKGRYLLCDRNITNVSVYLHGYPLK